MGGLLVFYGVVSLLGIDRNFIHTEGEWGFKEIAVLGATLLAGLFCGLLGFGVGATVEVRSEKINHLVSVLWHYLANGSIIWMLLLSLALTKALGKEGAKQLFEQLGVWYSSFAVIGTGTLASIAIAVLLLMTGQLGFESKPKFFRCFLLSLPLSVAMGYLQFSLFELSVDYWVIIGLIFPLALIPVSAMTIGRDARQRHEILSMTKS